MLNVELFEPEPPGPWVDEHRCVCGDHAADYRTSHYGITFADGADYLREQNQLAEVAEDPQLSFRDGGKSEAPGGFRGRSGVLYAMRILKLQRWYDDHASCDACNPDAEYPEDYAKEIDAWCDEIAEQERAHYDRADDDQDDDQDEDLVEYEDEDLGLF